MTAQLGDRSPPAKTQFRGGLSCRHHRMAAELRRSIHNVGLSTAAQCLGVSLHEEHHLWLMLRISLAPLWDPWREPQNTRPDGPCTFESFVSFREMLCTFSSHQQPQRDTSESERLSMNCSTAVVCRRKTAVTRNRIAKHLGRCMCGMRVLKTLFTLDRSKPSTTGAMRWHIPSEFTSQLNSRRESVAIDCAF